MSVDSSRMYLECDDECAVIVCLSISESNSSYCLSNSSRLPPVLGYSVEDELVPKWQYLCQVYTQGSFELSAFPAYFSYPLDKRIKTRYQYLQQVKGVPTQLLALDKVLRYGDREFATRVARDTDEGAAFLEFAKNGVQLRKRTPAKKKNKQRGAHGKSADKRI